METAPWNKTAWNQGNIYADRTGTSWSYVAMSLIWNVFSFPFFYLMIYRHYQGGWDPVLLLAFFPLVGLLLAWFSVMQVAHWRQLKNPMLKLNPFPGSLGGDFGGNVYLPVDYAANHQFTLKLQCLRNEGDTTTVLWEERGMVVAEAGDTGSMIRFRFAIPDNLPESSDQDQWKLTLSCDLPGLKLQCHYTVPVYLTPEMFHTTGVVRYTPAKLNRATIPQSVVEMSQLKNARRLYYPGSRNLKLGLALLFSAALLFGLTAFPSVLAVLNTSLGYGEQKLMYLLVSPALLLTAFAIYALGNSLEIFFTFDKIISIRRVLGIPFVRSIQVQDICALISKSQNRSRSKGQTFSLQAQTTDGHNIVLGDGIHGQRIAKRIKQLIRETLNTSLEWVEPKP
ncbi:MAG: hypothetical protein OEZ68_01570 [Gammaproteobacteria bacterium]|nr:hypothetical protein [Gammaproteobacteria bacterium]MDH5799468.1 hypothetical protein [Gammaproteobacteria bacterium]